MQVSISASNVSTAAARKPTVAQMKAKKEAMKRMPAERFTGLKKGDEAYSLGSEHHGGWSVTTIKFLRYLPKKEVKALKAYDGGNMLQDCVIETDGIMMISDSRDFMPLDSFDMEATAATRKMNTIKDIENFVKYNIEEDEDTVDPASYYKLFDRSIRDNIDALGTDDDGRNIVVQHDNGNILTLKRQGKVILVVKELASGKETKSKLSDPEAVELFYNFVENGQF